MKSDRSKTDLLLSVIIPTYNEGSTLKELLRRVDKAELPVGIRKEIIVIDDGSTDSTREITRHLSPGHILIKHEKNRGKGASVIDGFLAATGDFVVIQDADLEYDPDEYGKLLRPLLEGEADVVYGSRFLDKGKPSGMRLISRFANVLLTFWSNFFTGLELQDMETCYKMFNRGVVDDIKFKLVSQGFGIEPEITALIKKFHVVEVPISYHGRSVLEGKKVNWKDGVMALYDIARFNTPDKTKIVISFLATGSIGAGTNILLLYVFTEFFGWWYIASATLSFIIAAAASFCLQKFWTFSDSSTDWLHGQLSIYFILALFNLAANDGILYALVEYGRVHYILAQACASIIVAVWSFFAYKRLFRNAWPKPVLGKNYRTHF